MITEACLVVFENICTIRRGKRRNKQNLRWFCLSVQPCVVLCTRLRYQRASLSKRASEPSLGHSSLIRVYSGSDKLIPGPSRASSAQHGERLTTGFSGIRVNHVPIFFLPFLCLTLIHFTLVDWPQKRESIQLSSVRYSLFHEVLILTLNYFHPLVIKLPFFTNLIEKLFSLRCTFHKKFHIQRMFLVCRVCSLSILQYFFI